MDYYHCSLCERNIKTNFARQHLFLHINYTPFKCKYQNCIGQFPTENLLNIHYERKHSGKYLVSQ